MVGLNDVKSYNTAKGFVNTRQLTPSTRQLTPSHSPADPLLTRQLTPSLEGPYSECSRAFYRPSSGQIWNYRKYSVLSADQLFGGKYNK